MYVHGKLITVVVDTGASHSCISQEFFQSLPPDARKRLQHDPEFFATDASGNSMTCTGSVALCVSIPNNDRWNTVQRWQVLPGLPYDALIGLDLLVQEKGVVDLQKGEVRLVGTDHHTHSVPAFWYGEGGTLEHKPYTLVLSAGVHLPAGAGNVGTCTVQVPQKDVAALANCNGVVEPLISPMETSYMVAHSVSLCTLRASRPENPIESEAEIQCDEYDDSDTEDDLEAPEATSHSTESVHKDDGRGLECKVWLINSTSEHVYLRPGTKVARICYLSQGETVTLFASPDPTAKPKKHHTSEGAEPRPAPQSETMHTGEEHTTPVHKNGSTQSPPEHTQQQKTGMCANHASPHTHMGTCGHGDLPPRARPHAVCKQVPQIARPATAAHQSQSVEQEASTRMDSADPASTFLDGDLEVPAGVADPDTFTYPGLEPRERKPFARRVRRMLAKWNKVFSKKDGDLGLCKIDKLSLTLTTDQPIYRRPYNVPHHLKDKLQKQLDLWHAADVIENACSPYSAPLVLVGKKDGGLRVCVDFRALNAVTKKDGYPLPRIDNSLDVLMGAKVFTVMDLYGGFQQFEVEEKDREKLAFTTPSGQYQFKRAPMGVANMPSLFSRAMNTVFAGMLWVHLILYIDDLLVYSATCEEHFTHVEEVLARLHSAGLKLSGKKCQLFTDRVEYLGHVIGPDGISPDPGKIEAIKGKAHPTNIKELRSDLGLFSYYRGFVINFSATAEPLVRLLGESPEDKALRKKLTDGLGLPSTDAKARQAAKKARNKSLNAAFVWGAEQQEAYEALRKALISAPVLAHPDFSRPFIVDTDASNVALGGVCSQLDSQGVEHPVAYASRTLSKSERNYSTTKREGLGIYWGVCKAFRQYTYGAPFVLRTDHSSLTSIYGLGEAPEPIIAGWQMALSAYTYDIAHRPGKEHSNADGLSRPSLENLQPTPDDPDLTYPSFIGFVGARIEPHFPILKVSGEGKRVGTQKKPTHSSQLWAEQVTSSLSAPTKAEARAAQALDPSIRAVRKYLQQEKGSDAVEKAVVLEASRCTIADDIVYIWVLEQRTTRQPTLVPRIWLPDSLTERVLKSCHDQPEVGHYDAARTLHRITSVYWWPKVWQSTQNWVQTCDVCQKRKTPRMQKRLPVQEGITPTHPFQYVAMDITELATADSSNGLAYVLVFIDMFTRWAELKVFSHCPGAAEVTEALYTQVVARHGAPEYLLSDNGSNMSAQLVKNVCAELATKHITSSPYSPQTNGMVERFNRTFKNLLALAAQEQPSQWLEYVPMVLFAYRTACHAALNDSPFFLLYGRDPRDPLSYFPAATGSVDTVAYRRELMDKLSYARTVVQRTMHNQVDRHRVTANKKARALPELADLVLRERQEIRNTHAKNGVEPGKLQERWEGPFRVLRKIAPLTYDIQRVGTQDTERAHARHLKPYFCRDGMMAQELNRSDTPEDLVFEVQKIMKHRVAADTKEVQYLVRWRGYKAKDDTWEPHTSLQDTAAGVLSDYLRTLIGSQAPPAKKQRLG